MAATYEAIATVTVGSGGAANIEFTSIPATYTDLLLKVSARVTVADFADSLTITFNSNTGNIYNERVLSGNGSTVVSAARTSQSSWQYTLVPGSTATASTFGNFEFYIPNYAGSTNKSVSIDQVTENNATSASARLTAALFADTAAISSIKLAASTITQYSTATLYGIKNS
jgi:hypothetical protein